MDGRTDAQISPVFYRTSSPLGPLPCLLPNRPHSVDGQGKGTADHLLPLGDWFLWMCSCRLYLALFLSPRVMMQKCTRLNENQLLHLASRAKHEGSICGSLSKKGADAVVHAPGSSTKWQLRW